MSPPLTPAPTPTLLLLIPAAADSFSLEGEASGRWWPDGRVGGCGTGMCRVSVADGFVVTVADMPGGEDLHQAAELPAGGKCGMK